MSVLPSGWCSATLADLGEWSSGGTPSRKVPAYYGGSIPWVKTGDLDHAVVKDIEEFLTADGVKNSAAKVFPKGSLLVAMYGATIGQTGVLGVDAATNQACAALLAEGETSEIIPFVWLYLIAIQRDLRAAGQGGAQPNISQTILKSYPMPLPPLPEQRRIVAKIDSLTGKSKRARDHLDHIPRLVEKYKQAVLAAAFRGELTREWRARNPLNVASQEVLDEQRESLLAAQKRHALPFNSATVKQPDQPFKLPDSWNWVRAEALCGFITKGTTPPSSLMSPNEGDIPYIKVYNLTFDGSLDFDIDPTFITRETHEGMLARSKVVAGDVLMNIVGPPLGKVSIVPEVWAEWNINQAIAVFRPIASILPAYLAKWLLTDVLTRWAVARSKATAGQSNLTLEICRDLPVPLCSLEEQAEILRRVDLAISWITHLASEATNARKQIDHLDQAVLAKAFRGELVPQDPSDEPASILLERIRAERASAPKATRGRKAAANV